MSTSRQPPRPGRPARGSVTGRPIMALLDLLGRRWALRILWELRRDAAPTFRALQAQCDGVSSSVLTARLGELTEAGIVTRTDVGYALTPEGKALVRSLETMNTWALQWADRLAQQSGSTGKR